MGHIKGQGAGADQTEGGAQSGYDGIRELFANGDAAAAKRWIEQRGVDVDRCDTDALAIGAPTLLSTALASTGQELFSLLLQKSYLLKSVDPREGASHALGEACKHGCSLTMLKRVWRITQRPGANIQAASPLAWAIRNNFPSHAEFLLSKGFALDAGALGVEDPWALAVSSSGSKRSKLARLVAKALSGDLDHAFEARSSEDLLDALEDRDYEAALAAVEGGAVLPVSLIEPAAARRCPATGLQGAALAALRARMESVAQAALESSDADFASFMLMQTPMTRSELMRAAIGAQCQSSKIFSMCAAGWVEAKLADTTGSTLLHLAAARQSVVAARALMAIGANPLAKDARGATPLGMAKSVDHQALIEALSIDGQAEESDADDIPVFLNAPTTADDDLVRFFKTSKTGEGSAIAPSANVAPTGGAVEVFPARTIAKLQELAKTADAEKARMFNYTANQMKAHEGRRQVARAPKGDAIRALVEDFPNYAEVISDVAARADICRRAEARGAKALPFKLPNILIVGAPGMGKTHFAKELAKTCATAFLECQMGAMTAGFTLAGIDSSFASAKPGRIFKALAEGPYANPIILLDEIDKMSSNRDHPVSGSLFSLLERGSSKTWADEFIDGPMDASHINFLASANDLSTLQSALLSRFTVYTIEKPTPEQAAKLIRSVYREVLAREGWSALFEPEPTGEALEWLCEMTPRDAIAALAYALPRASMAGRDRVLPEDFKKKASGARTIGFM